MDERHWTKGAGLAALALCGAGMALAGTVAPDMYEMLKAQSYYGRPVLTLTAEPKTTAAPRGGLFELHYLIGNRGDASAHGVRLAFGDVRSLRRLETVGCANDPGGYPVCQLRSPLRAGETATVALFARVEPSASAAVRVEAVVASDDPNTDRSRTYNATQTPLAAH